MRRALPTLLLGLLPLALALAADRLLPPAVEEPLALRWARAVAAHPVRSTVAFGLLALALRGLPRSSRPPAGADPRGPSHIRAGPSH